MLRASILTLPLLLMSALAAAEQAISLSAEQARLLGIATAPANAAEHIGYDALSGEVQLPLAGSAAVATPYAGRVLKVEVDEGDVVSAGQRLALVASHDYAAQRAQLLRAESALALARKQAARDQALLDAGVIAASRVEASAAARTAAEADLAALRATVGTLPAASAGPGSFALLAPLAGRVVERHVSAGAALEELAVAFVIAADSGWRLEVAVPMALAHDVGSGASLRVGNIIAPVDGRGVRIDTATQTVHVRATLPPDSALAPGQRVSAELLLPAPPDALAVPRAAITRVGDEASVFVQQPSGFERVPVTLHGDLGASSVVSGKLKVGDAVVVNGVSSLKALQAE